MPVPMSLHSKSFRAGCMLAEYFSKPSTKGELQPDLSVSVQHYARFEIIFYPFAGYALINNYAFFE